MDRAEANEVTEARLATLRQRTHAQLVAEWLYQPRSERATATSGRPYALEIEAVWDDRPSGALRVWILVGSVASTGTIGGRRAWTVSMISVLSMPGRRSN